MARQILIPGFGRITEAEEKDILVPEFGRVHFDQAEAPPEPPAAAAHLLIRFMKKFGG